MITYLGDNLYTLRRSAGISQDELAERLGVSRQAVSKWERGEAYPDTENLIAISRLFGVTLDELINSDIADGSALKDEPERESERTLTVTVEKGFSLLYAIPYPVVITIVYLLLGFLSERGFEVGWTLYVTIPVYYSVIGCIKERSFSSFAYPVLVTFVFLLLGMLFGIWHPLWIIYLTIPIYYAIADAADRLIFKK